MPDRVSRQHRQDSCGLPVSVKPNVYGLKKLSNPYGLMAHIVAILLFLPNSESQFESTVREND